MRPNVRIMTITGFLLCCASQAVPAWTLDDLLRNAQRDPRLDAYSEEPTGCSGLRNGIPGIDDIELRLRTTAFDLNNQRYGIRIKPRGVFESRNISRYTSAVQTSCETRRTLLLNTALFARYLLHIDLQEHLALRCLYHQLDVLFEDRIRVLEKSSLTESFAFEDLIRAEHDRTKNQTCLYEIEKMVGVLQYRARTLLTATDSAAYDSGTTVVIDTIINRIECTTFILDTNNVTLRYQRCELEQAQARCALEKARGRRYIDFVGFSYDNGEMSDQVRRRNDDKDYNLNDAYMVELGLRIPDLTTSRDAMSKRSADLIRQTENFTRARLEMEDKINKDLLDLRQLIEQYRYLLRREREVNAQASLKRHLQITGSNPAVLLYIQENILKNRISRTQTMFGILRNYIRVLDNSGTLCATPLRNHLSIDPTPLEP